MNFFTKKNVLFLTTSVALFLGAGMGTVTQVHADQASNTSKVNITIPDKNLISAVASNDNQTLRQVAIQNNDSLNTLEKLNNNINPDKVIPNGTPLYLPQNVTLNNLFMSLYTVHSGLSHAQYEKYYGKLSRSERAAKEWIAFKESSYDYHAKNGVHYGRFQLDKSYLHGNYSIANQERTADRYVKKRYGSWVAAKRFWLSHGWY